MKSIEVEGKTKDEALAKGLASLGLSRAQVQVDILDEGGRGFLGLGGKPARLRLRAIAPGEVDPAEIVRTLLELMSVKFSLAVETRGEETDIRIDAPEDDGLLIGRRGQTLDALRHLSQRIVAARKGRNAVVNIDVGDYRARREANLGDKAKEIADQVIAEGRSLTLDPMSAQDRRIVHVALAERTDVSTYTVGRGSRRRVVIAPAGEHADETAYDRVPDPGFRARRMPYDESEEDAAMLEAEAQWRREEERERLEAPSSGARQGQRPGRESRGGARRRSEGAAIAEATPPGVESEERGPRPPRRRGGRGRGRDSRERGASRGESRREDGAPETEEHAPNAAPAVAESVVAERPERGVQHVESDAPSHGREERGRSRRDGERGRDDHRRDRGDRGDRGDRRGRDRGERRHDGGDRWGFGEDEAAAGPAITRPEELSPARRVDDGSEEKAFPSEIARRVLKLGGDEGGAAQRRRRRR